MRVGRCSMWNHRKENYAKTKVWMGELKYSVLDGCMLLNKSSTISENCKERKRQAVLFSGARTLTLTVEKVKRVHKLATGACKNWIFFAVDNFPPCNNFCTVSCACGWSTRDSSIWPVLFVHRFKYWTRDAFLKFSQSYDMVGLTAGLLADLDWTFWS